MNSFEKFIEDHSFVEDHGWGGLCVSVESLREFLEGKVIVPRKPVQLCPEVIDKIVKDAFKGFELVDNQYILRIKGSEHV